jgi:hypothetical protein
VNFPIRQDIEILPADTKPTRDRLAFQDQIIITSKGRTQRKHRHLNLGWTVRETISVAVINPRSLEKLTKKIIIEE